VHKSDVVKAKYGAFKFRESLQVLPVSKANFKAASMLTLISRDCVSIDSERPPVNPIPCVWVYGGLSLSKSHSQHRLANDKCIIKVPNNLSLAKGCRVPTTTF